MSHELYPAVQEEKRRWKMPLIIIAVMMILSGFAYLVMRIKRIIYMMR